MSQKVGSAALVQALDGSGLYTEQRNLELWQQVPPELRLTEFSPRTLPDHPAFRWRLGCRPEWRGFDLGPLPEPMQRDFAYCLWRVIDSGLTITAPYALLVNWFVYLAEDVRAAGRPPLRSLIDRSISDWEHELIKERARRRGKIGWPKFGPAAAPDVPSPVSRLTLLPPRWPPRHRWLPPQGHGPRSTRRATPPGLNRY